MTEPLASLPPVVFLGPSLPLSEARRVLPGADYRPPIRRGDLAEMPGGRVVGIIDGVFEQDRAVSYAEVHEAVLRGVIVLGSSSMGALRAAEVRGVIGVGRIHEMLVRGEIESNDAVALLFDPDTLLPVTVPLVNVLYAVERLTRSATIDEPTGRRIVEAAKGLYYKDRTYPAVLRRAGLGGSADYQQLLSIFRSIDLKREDAQLLLERIPHVMRASPEAEPSGAALSRHDYIDALHGIEARGEMPAGAPALVWESGDRVVLRDLVAFLKLTNRFQPAARRALSRFALEGNPLPSPDALDEAKGQDLFDELTRRWGWLSENEVHVTLVDLGVGLNDLEVRLAEEVAALETVRRFGAALTDDFLRALRAELLFDDLSLKREVLRLGSLRRLAALAKGGEPTESELGHARRAIVRLHDPAAWWGASFALLWDDLSRKLAAEGLAEAEMERFLRDLALARRATETIVDVLSRAHRRPGPVEGQGLEMRAARRAALGLAPCPKAPGDRRFKMPMDEAEAIARRLADAIGVTRVGLEGDITELGVFVGFACRPEGMWSSTRGSGKSLSRGGAVVGSVMEEVEKWAQERAADPSGAARLTGSYEAMRDRHPLIDPADLDLPYDSCYAPGLELPWSLCRDLVTGEEVYMPASPLVMERLPADIYYSPRLGTKVQQTNGLASGFALEEALVHALCEVIERHAACVAQLLLENPGGFRAVHYRLVDLDTAPPSVAGLAEMLQRGGASVRVLDITSEVKVPTFAAQVTAEGPFGSPAPGWAAHPNPAVAIEMAILEACQALIGWVAGAREDYTLKARSLGRHERARPERCAAYLHWYGHDAGRVDFADLCGLNTGDALTELEWIIERLVAAGIRRAPFFDLSRDELLPARVVRVFLPGLESSMPFRYGPRARAQMLADLLIPAQTKAQS